MKDGYETNTDNREHSREHSTTLIHDMEDSLSFVGKAYKGRYGPESKHGNVIYSDLKVEGSKDVNPHNRELQILIDLSGSMYSTLPSLKASLLALRDFIRGEDPSVSLDEKINLTLIGYNAAAFVIYETGKDQDFDSEINKMKALGMTNMGAAIELAFERASKDRCTWMIVLSDGMSNTGLHQTHESFKELKEKTPSNTHIITVGYGDEFNSKILCELGDFTYIESDEMIPTVFGSLAHEIMTSWGFGAAVYFDVPGVFVVGNESIGTLYQERRFISGLLVDDEVFKGLQGTDSLGRSRVTLRYTDIDTMDEISRTTKISLYVEDAPEEYRERYYNASKGRRINLLYEGEDIPKVCAAIKETVAEWTEECARIHKEDLLRLVNNFEHAIAAGKGILSLRNFSAALKSDSTRQVHYHEPKYFTPSQIKTVKRIAEAAEDYMSYSPDKVSRETTTPEPRPKYFSPS